MSSSAQDREEIHGALDAWLNARKELARANQEFEAARARLLLINRRTVETKEAYERLLGDAQ